eukprot:6397860-Prymnesium_polylepis.1
MRPRAFAISASAAFQSNLSRVYDASRLASGARDTMWSTIHSFSAAHSYGLYSTPMSHDGTLARFDAAVDTRYAVRASTTVGKGQAARGVFPPARGQL